MHFPLTKTSRASLLFTILNLAISALGGELCSAESPPNPNATTLHRKVMCGYQGWFRCPGDSSGEGWRHWGRDSKLLSPKSLTVEMWPDLSEYTDEERFAAPGFTHPDGSPAHLFSSCHPKTVERHFAWMQQYGIDGAFVQRFLVDATAPSSDQVLTHARKAAAKSGRTYAICYDLSGMRENQIYERLTQDWKRLVDDSKITHDERYLHHADRPVVFVWGFYSDRFSPELVHRIVDFFHAGGSYSATLVGGCQWYWLNETNGEWARAFRRFDVLSPWNVGNVSIVDRQKQANTSDWKADLAETKQNGMLYLPVLYPGFAWTNLKGPASAKDTIPRLGGEFFWKQFAAAGELGVDMAYIAMFDEVDEATAIFKVTNTPPTQAEFATYQGLPSDWYLRLSGEGAKVIRGETKPQAELPIKP
jgi:hypothetical protein